ncbi:hypothetical protein CBM2600_A120631 [Cupriavidus taiwanensis]|nr:hypothetical protein CBM2600_A120631 [Cupriavidus taiwanensis]
MGSAHHRPAGLGRAALDERGQLLYRARPRAGFGQGRRRGRGDAVRRAGLTGTAGAARNHSLHDRSNVSFLCRTFAAAAPLPPGFRLPRGRRAMLGIGQSLHLAHDSETFEYPPS